MNKKTFKLCISSALVLASLASNAQTTTANPSNDIYRYKDKNGNFIYTDKYPKDKTLEVGILSKKTGIIKNKSDLDAAEAAQQMTPEEKMALANAKVKEEEQIKKDQFLLNTYSSVKEIDKIKQYELEQIDKSIQSDMNNIANVKERREQLDKEIKANPATKSSYDAEIGRINDLLARYNSSLDKNKKMYAEREKKYNDEKDRFNAVMNLINKEKETKQTQAQPQN